MQRPELDAALVEKATVALAIIGVVCRFAISADFVEERVLDQYSTFLTPRRSASTAYSTFVHLKRICEELRHAILVDHGCTKNLERGGRSTQCCSSYKRKRDVTWGPVYYKDAEIERVLVKRGAAATKTTTVTPPPPPRWLLSVALHAFDLFEAFVNELVGRTCNAFQPVPQLR